MAVSQAVKSINVYRNCYICCEIAARLKLLLEANGFEVQIAPPAWTMEQRAANANGFHYYLCIHTNASGNGSREGTATGCECLYYNAPASIKANQLAYNELTKLYPSKRGIKDYSSFAENNLTQMVSCYPEIAFHDNGKDARWLVDNKSQIAAALCKAVCGYFGVQYKQPPQQPPSDTQAVAVLKVRNQELEDDNRMLVGQLEGYSEKLAAIKKYIASM